MKQETRTFAPEHVMPVDFIESRHWLFPLSSAVESGSLNPGDRHMVHFSCHRLFVTNTHLEEMNMRIVDGRDDGVTTRMDSNTGYLASYKMLDGTGVSFEHAGPHYRVKA